MTRDPGSPMTAESLADLLETMVNIPSETGSEGALADWLARRLEALPGGRCTRSGHSLVWRAAARERPLLVLAGHLDTVPANGNARARREDGRLYGVGSTDMKSGDAVMLALAEGLDAARARFDLALVVYEAEEGPLERNGLTRLLAEMPWLAQARLAIRREATALKVELGCN